MRPALILVMMALRAKSVNLEEENINSELGERMKLEREKGGKTEIYRRIESKKEEEKEKEEGRGHLSNAEEVKIKAEYKRQSVKGDAGWPNNALNNQRLEKTKTNISVQFQQEKAE